MSGDGAVTAAHPVGVRDLCTPMMGEPHFDELGGGVGSSGPVMEQIAVPGVADDAELGDRRVLQPAVLEQARHALLIENLRSRDVVGVGGPAVQREK